LCSSANSGIRKNAVRISSANGLYFKKALLHCRTGTFTTQSKAFAAAPVRRFAKIDCGRIVPAWEKLVMPVRPAKPARKQPLFLKPSAGGASSAKSLMWMMIAFFAGLGVLLGAGLFVASRAVRSMGLSAASARDSIKTPGGTFRLEQEAQVGPGLPVYPRASLIVPDDATAAAAIKQAQQGIDVSAYQSSDTRDFVDSWYAKHLSPEFTRHDPGEKLDGTFSADAHISEDDVVFLAQRDEKVRAVTLSADPSGTKISLIRFNKPSAPSAPQTESAPAPAAATTSDPTTGPQQ
jgi:hypothetical protein